MPIEKGKMVTEHVRLDTLLGEGGMGSVWIADHTRMDEQVAVKFISTELLEKDETVRTRFSREAALAAQIDSPYVVKILDLGTMDDGTPFFVMERLTGENLGERITRLGPLSLIDARKVVTETAMALARAHKLGIVHRDIKPDNLFLVEADEAAFVKVLDFGIAKQTEMPEQSVVTMTGAMMGTPEFMSPEQVLSAKDVDYRSDLWSLGVVAYYALTERVPFSGETLGALCVAIANGKFVPASTAEPGLPPAIDEWFDRALALDPADRFQSARDMARAFGRALGPLGKPQDDDFSRTGSLQAPDGGDWFGEGAEPGADTIPDGQERRATSAAAKTVASKRSVTFSGAAMSAASQSRARSRAAVGGLALVGMLVGGGAVMLLSGPTEETVAPGSSQTTGAATATATESQAADDGAPAPDPSVPPAGESTAGAGAAGGTGGAAPEASAAPTSEPSATKTVARKPRPRPKSSAEPATPPPSATASTTASHAPAPSASVQEKDRGF